MSVPLRAMVPAKRRLRSFSLFVIQSRVPDNSSIKNGLAMIWRVVGIGILVFLESFNVGRVAAQQNYFVADRLSNQIIRLRDANGDGDALDISEHTIWARGFSLIGELVGDREGVFAVDQGSQSVLRIIDVNGDGDALDNGEQTLWGDGMVSPQGIARDGEAFFVTDQGNNTVWRFEDANGDGDALDAGERTTFAAGLTTPASAVFAGDGLFVTDATDSVVRSLRDTNGDNDALDVGENVVVSPALAGTFGATARPDATLYVTGFESQTMYRLADLNQDGDMLDIIEAISYADNVFGGLDDPWGIATSGLGGFLIGNTANGAVHQVRDVNGDGDALDLGESTLFAEGVGFPVSIVPTVALCDLNADFACNVADINLLFAQGDLVSGVNVGVDNVFDLHDDRTLDSMDIDRWLDEAAIFNGYSSPFRRGDTDDVNAIFPHPRDIDITDFNNLATSFTPVGDGDPTNGPLWNEGNFDGDDDVDITDFNFLAANFSSAGYGTDGRVVPEPTSAGLWILAGCVIASLFRWRDSLCDPHK